MKFEIAVLYARRDSIYKTIPGLDVYDIDRDALTFKGDCPVIAHPPCRSWGKLSHFAQPRFGEKNLAFHALDMVRRNGGVLEHPRGSRLFSLLPSPGKRDIYGGFVLGLNQSWFGHRAEKSTLLYICGINPCNIPVIPLSLDYPITTVVKMNTPEREKTPSAFAAWLVDLACRCQSRSEVFPI